MDIGHDNNNFSGNNQLRTDREKSFDSQQSAYNLLSSPTSQGPSIVSKRAALFEQNNKREMEVTRTISPPFQSLDSSRHSFGRSNLSPLSKVTKFEESDVAQLASAGASVNSFRQENKRQMPDSQANSFKRVQQTMDTQMDIGMDTDALNPGMSISERRKMFSSSPGSGVANQRLAYNDGFDVKSANKRSAISNNNSGNRFLNQVIFSFYEGLTIC